MLRTSNFNDHLFGLIPLDIWPNMGLLIVKMAKWWTSSFLFIHLQYLGSPAPVDLMEATTAMNAMRMRSITFQHLSCITGTSANTKVMSYIPALILHNWDFRKHKGNVRRQANCLHNLTMKNNFTYLTMWKNLFWSKNALCWKQSCMLIMIIMV